MPNNLLNTILKLIFAVRPKGDRNLNSPKSFLIIRQHNQLGDLLATVSFFRAIKEKYTDVKIVLVVSPANYAAITKNKYIDEYFIFDKRKLFNPFYFFKLVELLRRNYDVAVVPVTVSISFTSNFLARLSKAKTRIGIEELNRKKNAYDFFFDRKVKMDWHKHPDANVSDFCLDMLRPFGISTSNYKANISFDNKDIESAEEFINSLNKKDKELLVGLHIGAGKPPNRWSLDKYAGLMTKLNSLYEVKYYVTGSDADIEEINYLKEHIKIPFKQFINRQIPEVAALISMSDLFITNDTGIMHVAGTTETPQISIFGPTNPYNWAPIGRNKYFIRKSDLIDDITEEEVFNLCRKVLSKESDSIVLQDEKKDENFLAVIDCGSNSFHLIIAKINGNNEFEIVARERTVIRVGELIEEKKSIPQSIIQKAVYILNRYKKIAQTYSAPIHAVATSAIREMQNREEIIGQIKLQTGININIIDGKEEARLIFLGANKALQFNDKKVLCIDIGGGSTEFIVGMNNQILYSNSVELGAVRLSTLFFPDYTLTKERIEKCKYYIQQTLSNVYEDIVKIGFEKCVGTSGTIMSSAYMIQARKGKLPENFYTLNNYNFSADDFSKIEKAVLEKTSAEQRKQIPGIDEGRADIIPAGMLILSSIIKTFSLKEITVSGFAIREGLILSVLSQDR